MLAKRIIPCLDIKDGKTVKGVNFENLRDAGDPIELAAVYAQQGADEIVFLDISATNEQRDTLAELARNVAMVLNIPFTIGGGIKSVAQVEVLLQSGADKISINSAAVKRPELINELALAFGSQCVVLAVDIKKDPSGQWKVWLNGGRLQTEWLATDWIKEAVERGAGEILLTSMDHDGVKEGFALDITRTISQSVAVPVIASGGAGKVEHFKDVFTIGAADAALAASIFHFGEIPIPSLKNYLQHEGISIRR
ncbi:MAG: imidazole glycerol phosphate synthase subunit HisF [Bacteroidota bacterium]